MFFYPPTYPPMLILSDKFRLIGSRLSLRAKNELAEIYSLPQVNHLSFGSTILTRVDSIKGGVLPLSKGNTW